MSSFPTAGGPSHYYGNKPQDETYHEPPQFYNPHAPHETYDQSGYREPELYRDEPSYTLPQGQSMEPLGATTKEEPDYVVDEFNPTPRQSRCVHRRASPFMYSGLRVFLLIQDSPESSGMEVPARSPPLDAGAYKSRAASVEVS